VPPGDAQIEATPGPASERSRDQAVGIVRQNRIGMQEHKRRAGAECRAGIHPCAAAAWTDDHAVGQRTRQRRRAVAAAAVDHDHFRATIAQRRERLQRRSDDRRFVKRRNDDGERPHRGNHAGNIAEKRAVGQRWRSSAFPGRSAA
jgi:hypothetical protein